MATLSLLNYNLTVGLNIKMSNNSSNENKSLTNVNGLAQGERLLNKTFNKITVQNVLSENHGNSLNIANSNPNAIVRKIKDFGMIGSVNNASGAISLNMNSRKRPLNENKQQNQKLTDTKTAVTCSKKPKLTKEEKAAIRLAKKQAKENSNVAKLAAKQSLALLQPIKIPGTPGRKGLPLPQAVARRNARERNRVKQVNNGFAALRERIPEEVAEVFDNQGSNRGAGKKLSKVETLRMAVEYIRSLERLLGFDFPVGNNQHNASSGEDSFSLIKDEFDSYSPSMDEHFDDSLSHYDNEEFFNSSNSNAIPLSNSSPPQPLDNQHMDMLPNITTLNGLQYIRIPGTNTYQLLTPDIFVGTAASPPSSTIDEEHFNTLIDTNCRSPSSLSSSPPTTAMLQTQTSTSPPSSSLSPAVNAIEVMNRVKETPAPVLATNEETFNAVTNTQTTSTTSSSLLSTPVLQNQEQQTKIIPLLTSPSVSPQQLQQEQQQTQQQLQTLSPASTNNDQLQPGLILTCATNQQQQQRTEFILTNASDQQQQIGMLHMIKQEFEEPSVIYQQQPQQLYHTVLSPPIDRNTPSTSNLSSSASSHILPSLFTNQQNVNSFYEGMVTLKKEFNDVLLDASHSTNVLTDENMMDAIDWWEAHTPKSDGGNIMM